MSQYWESAMWVIHWQVIVGKLDPAAIPLGYLIEALYGSDYPQA